MGRGEMSEHNATTNPRLAVELDGNVVRLVFICQDQYAAMRFYDEVCLGAKDGPMLRIDVEVVDKCHD